MPPEAMHQRSHIPGLRAAPGNKTVRPGTCPRYPHRVGSAPERGFIMTKPAVHPVDQGLPAGRLALLGLQHMSIMYAGSVAVPLIVGSALKLDPATIGLLVNADLLVAGIATMIQAIGIGKILGIRLPVVAGATFSVVNPMILIASQYGLPAVYGAMLASGVFGLIIA